MIPSSVLSDKRLSANAKLIYGEIYSLADENGLCYPSNNHFTQILGLTERSASRCISLLKELGLIHYEVDNNNQRVIQITQDRNVVGVGQLSHRGVGQKSLHSNTQESKTLKNNNIDSVPTAEDKNSSLEEEIKDIESADRIKTEHQFLGLQMWETLRAPSDKKGSFIKVARDENPGLVNEAFYFAKNFPVQNAKWKVFFKHIYNAKQKIAGGTNGPA